MTLNPEQTKACETFLQFLTDPQEKVMVLDGDAGSGKTFLTNHFIQLAETHSTILKALCNEHQEIQFLLSATTNKAAAVIRKLSGRDADTIHSHLGLYVKDDYTNGKQILTKSRNYEIVKNTLLVIDESSMIDRQLQKYIRESTLNCKTLFVGDSLQLPPVFESCSPVFNQGHPKITLTNQCRHQGIIGLAPMVQQFKDSIITGEFKDIIVNSPNIQLLTGQQFQYKLLEEFTKSVPDNRVLAYTNAKVQQYNLFLKANLTASESFLPGEYYIQNGIYWPYGCNAPVLNNEEICQILTIEESTCWLRGRFNTYEIPVFRLRIRRPYTNTDTIYEINQPTNLELTKDMVKAAASNKDWDLYFKLQKNLADLRMPYASTIHKSQGDTFKNIFINLNDISKCKDPNLVARMLYVAFTRATNNIYLYGELSPKYGKFIYV